jgi:hypothetical protein
MTGGAFGSLFAQLFHLSANERKTLLGAGAAAGRLPVVDRAEHWKVVGYLGRAEVLSAQLKRYEEDVREPGYLEIRSLKKLIPKRN